MRTVLEVAIDRFQSHDAFDRQGDRTFTQVTTPFGATATLLGREEAVQIHVVVELDSLDAVVPDGVPEVVETGWFETFERRVSDATTVTADETDPVPDVTRGSGTVIVDATIETSGDRAPRDAKAVVDFVEATWIQGLIPGYDYDDPAASLLGDARSRS